jgi:hypothetical protein
MINTFMTMRREGNPELAGIKVALTNEMSALTFGSCPWPCPKTQTIFG